jgi:putative transcriptional regulator
MRRIFAPETLLLILVFLAPPVFAEQQQDPPRQNKGPPLHNPRLDKGVLLIAGENLNDPNFSRSVVLITEFNDGGTLGLIINQRTKIPSPEFLPEIRELVPLLEFIYTGGPVASGYINMLIKSDQPVPGATEVIKEVYLVNSLKIFKALPLDKLSAGNLRLYSGLAGWAPGQLESELVRGDWYIWHASTGEVFNTHPELLWEELIRLVTARWVWQAPAVEVLHY